MSFDVLEKQKEGRSGEREEEAGKAGWGQTMQDLVNLRISEFFKEDQDVVHLWKAFTL